MKCSTKGRRKESLDPCQLNLYLCLWYAEGAHVRCEYSRRMRFEGTKKNMRETDVTSDGTQCFCSTSGGGGGGCYTVCDRLI